MKHNSILYFFWACLLLTQFGCGEVSDTANAGTEPNAPATLNASTGILAIANPDAFRALAVPIIKEPKYQTQPMYALLTFGEEANRQSWLVVDGQRIFVDKNGNGDLTDPEDLVLRDDIATKELKIAPCEYKRMDIFPFDLPSGKEFQLHVWVKDESFDYASEPDHLKKAFTPRREKNEKYGWSTASLYGIGFGSQHTVMLCADSSRCQVSNLDGILTFRRKSPIAERLSRTDERNLSFQIGSMGIGPEHCEHDTCFRLSTKEFPEDLHPNARFEFPSTDPNRAPIVLNQELDLRC